MNMMGSHPLAAQSQPLPSFRRPPVVETVLAVQFVPLRGMTNAHWGAYWKSLDEPWTLLTEVDALPQVNEHFGDAAWNPASLIELRVGPPPVRLQIVNVRNDRMIQIQNGWFVYNWRLTKRCADYPRYSAVRIEFDRALAHLRDFMKLEGFADMRPNLWEVTYVNHLDRGPLWDRPNDWPKLLPGLLGEPPGLATVAFEGGNGDWRFELLRAAAQARLHVNLLQARRSRDGETAIDTLVLRLTARGNLTGPELWTQLGAGLDVGHEAVVQTFAALTSDEAHQHWERDR